MSRIRRVAVAATSAVLLFAGLSGCAANSNGGNGSVSNAPAPSGTLASAPPSTTPTSAPPTIAPTTTDPVISSTITYDWGVPSSQVGVSHPVTPPIAAPPEPPLPYLVGVYVGDHPEKAPTYQRLSFYFRGGFPSYNFKYVLQVLADGSGLPISLSGNRFLQVGFVDAQAHNNSGATTVIASPGNPINVGRLKSYAAAGDFEGHVTYGMGLAAGTGEGTPQVRAGEVKKSDGSGGFLYVIYFDIAAG